MTTNFPTSVDSFPDPLATDRLDNPPHDVLHTNINSAVEAIETALLDGAPLHIDDANERVGIGTTTPESTLEVNGILTANHIHGNIAGAVYLHVKNTSGVTIPAGSPVYATGSVGASGATEVAISDADAASTMPALGIVDSELVANAEGHATVLGVAKGLDTSAWSVNDSLYVSVSGGLTNVRPTGASELVQKIGRVIRSDANTGEVLVLGAGRSNDVPNGLSPTITLAGDASGSVTLTDLGSGTLTVTVADDSHNHSTYLPLSGGTMTGTLTGTSIVATTGIDAGYVGKTDTGRYTYITAWPTDGNWIAVNGGNGYLLLDGNYADDDIYLRTYNNSGRVNIGAGHSNTLGVDNGSITVSGTGYATNWSVGTGSSANAFIGGSNYWRPQDAYGNSYFDINSGQFYVDSDTYYFRNRASVNSLVIDSSGNGSFTGTVSASRLQVGGHYIDDVAGGGNPYGSINVGGAMTWDGYAIDNRVVFMHDGGSYAGLYNDVNNHWMVYCTLNGGVELRYQGGSKFYVDSSGSVTNGRHYATGDVDAGGKVTTSGGNGQIIMSGGNQPGAMYFSGGASSSSTGAIEASWRGSLNPSIAIGVSRDYDRTRFEAAYNGYAIIYVDNTERLRCTTGGVTYNGSFGASSIRIKENVRDASEVEGYASPDRDVAFEKLLSLRPVVYDLKEHAHDKLWVGCDEHEHRFACEEAGCVNDRVERVEHVCGQGWCYGTLENPCPKYTGTRNKLHFIAEEVHEVYGDHGVGFNEMREVESVDHQSLYTEHINATQHLIRYVAELESRIRELETV